VVLVVGGNMKKIYKFIINTVVIGFAIFGYAFAWGADWKLYIVEDKWHHYFDAENIMHPSKNIVRVWTKTVYSDKGRIWLLRDFGKNWENVYSAISLEEINCNDKKYRFLSQQYYSEDGGILFSAGERERWEYVIPESLSELLFEKVCR
jgi:hypothetical protein